MLAVTANWLLTDGSLARPYAPAADAWLSTIRRAMIRAGFQRDGRYEPVESASLVLAGDTFDWLMSAAWSGRQRPWDGSPQSREVKAHVVRTSLHASRRLLGGLLRWTRLGIPVPGAEARGRPSARGIVYVPLRIALLSGDRDSWLAEAPLSATGLNRSSGVWLGEAWSDGDLTIRHGHERDPSTHPLVSTRATGKRLPALAESLAIDLVVPFAMELKAESRVWSWARPQIAAIAASDPMAMPQAVADLADRLGKSAAAWRTILAAWRRCVSEWTKRTRHEPPDCATEHDVMDALAYWFKEGVETGERSAPRAVARLATPRDPSVAPGLMLGHTGLGLGIGNDGGPWLTVVRPGRSAEPLGPVCAESSIVTIGALDGGGIVEAA